MCGKSGRCTVRFFKVVFLSKDSREEAFHLQTLQKRADWVADEPVNYLERLFVRQRLQKRFSFSSVSVYKVKRSPVCQKWISGGDSEALGSSQSCSTRQRRRKLEGDFGDFTQQDGFHSMHKPALDLHSVGFL